MASNPFDHLIPGAQPQPHGSLQPLIQRRPAPQTEPQRQTDEFQAQRGPFDVRRSEAEARKAEFEADTAQDTRAGQRDDRRYTRIERLRNEFNDRPDVRRFFMMRDATRQIQRLSESDSAQNDMAIIFSFMRALDPTSVVREGEFANAQNTAGVPDQVRNMYNRALSGERLNETQRRGMARTAGDLYLAQARSYNELARQYQPLFQQLGEDPNRHIQIALGPEREGHREEAPTVGYDPEAIRGAARTRSESVSGVVSEGAEEFRSRFERAINEGQFRNLEDALAFTERWNPTVARDPNWQADVANALRYRENGGRSQIRVQAPISPAPAEEIAERRIEQGGEPGAGYLFQQGAMLNLGDEAAGVGGALANALTSPFTEREFDPIGAYGDHRDAERLLQGRARENSGWVGTGAEILGGLASGRPGASLLTSTPQTIGQRMATGARGGASTGLIAGFGHGEGVAGSLAGAGAGASGGALIGGALPLAGAAASSLWNAGRTLAGRNPNVARGAVAEAIEADANTPRLIGQQMSEAQANGVPYMIADSGDNARGLLAASVRAPGSGRTLARDALEQRQEGLSDRVTGAIERDLGSTSNPHDIADQLIAQAQTAAAPLYERAYAVPGAGTLWERLGPLTSRPSMQRALSRASRLAQEEGRDPSTLGFSINSAGETTVGRTPSWQTLDYLKRGMDDVIESYRDSTTGRLNLDTEGRAINNTLRTFLSRMDEANPAYAEARAAWSGPVRARDALERGLRAANMSADDISRLTRDMSPSEMEMFRHGVRRSMAETIARRGDTADVTNALLGTGRKRLAMVRLFGGKQEFDRFVSTLQAEQAGHQTFRRATQGSPTAQNLGDDAALSGSIASGMADMMTTGMPVVTGVRQAFQFGARRAGDQARKEIATLLSESDPSRLSMLAKELRRESARRTVSRTRAGRRAPAYGIGAGGGVGRVIDAYDDPDLYP